MEKGQPSITNHELEDQSKGRASGFFERWQKKLRPEKPNEESLKLPEATEPAVGPSKNQETVASFSLKRIFATNEYGQDNKAKVQAIPEADEEPLGARQEVKPDSAETDKLYTSTKKIGGRVLRFATALLNEVKELPTSLQKTELAQASHELDESQQHLTQELEELEVAAHSTGDPAQRQEAYSPSQINVERVKENESKGPAFVVAQLAVLAIAGAGIFMAALGSEHRSEHRLLKTHRKSAKETLKQQSEELKLQEHSIAQQKEQLKIQSADLQQLKQRDLERLKQKERTAFVYQVSELAEQQAEITHEVAELLQTARPITFERKASKVEAVSAERETFAESSNPAKTRETTQSGSVLGAGGYSPLLHKNATQSQETLQTSPKQDTQSAKQPVKDAWIYVAIVTTLVIASVSWMLVQLVIR